VDARVFSGQQCLDVGGCLDPVKASARTSLRYRIAGDPEECEYGDVSFFHGAGSPWWKCG
jgi:hypothetical protein